MKPPELLAGLRVVRRDDAGIATRVGLTLATRDHFAVGDDGAAAGRRTFPRIEHGRFPHELTGLCVERVDDIVGARVDDRVAPDRDGPVRLGTHAFRQLALVFPEEVAGLCVDRHDVVARARQEHHPVVDERRALLVPGSHEPARPHHAELRHVVARNLVERAVAPAIEGAPPHQPVGGVGLLEHRVGHRHEFARALLRLDGEAAQNTQHDERDRPG